MLRVPTVEVAPDTEGPRVLASWEGASRRGLGDQSKESFDELVLAAASGDGR